MKHDKLEEIAKGIRSKLSDIQSLLSLDDLLNEKISSINSANEKVVSWSKTNSFSLIPFYNELTGFKPGEMLHNEPKNKKNVYCYFSDGENINKVDSYNSKGDVEDTSYIIWDEHEAIEIRKDARGDFIAISKLFLDVKKNPVASYFVNDDNSSGYYYFYEGGLIDKILVVSINSPLPYVILSCVYDKNGVISEIYFCNKKGKVNVYPRE